MSFFDEVVPEDPGRERSARRRVWLVLGLLVLLAAAAYVALHRHAVDRVPLGTTVEGVPVGGLTADAAVHRLAGRLDPALETPITFVHGDRTLPLVPARAGVAADWAGTVAAAGAGADRWSPKDLWDFYTGGRDLTARFDIDPQRFANALDGLTRQIGRTAIEGTVEFHDGTARPVFGRTGLAVNHAKAQAIVQRLAFDHHRAELPIAVRHPYISRAEVRRAMTQFARPAMAAPVRLVIGGHAVMASPRLFGDAISMIPQRGRLVPLVNGSELVQDLRPVMRTLGPRPRDASVEIRDGRPHVTPAVYGASYDIDELASLFSKALRSGDDRVVRLHAAITAPRRTTADVRALGIRQRVGSFTVTGGTALLPRLENVLIRPGDSLHLADRLGTSSRPLGTALFAAALRAGVAIPSWTASSAFDDSLPVGMQATDVTVAPQPGRGALLVDARQHGADRVTVSIWSTPVRRVTLGVGARRQVSAPSVVESHKRSCVPRRGVPGFIVTVHRRVVVERDNRLAPEKYVSTYAPVSTIRCVPRPPSTSTASSG
ncbi:peptidoglycan binding domain-containing protein [Nocardioides terrisoli]|uniref:peptidoglycan binding domain-containing protein n=1 Tax=Nocardioides terrisoli TaxID=3388267 RepID=UPI00287B72D8|nr:peptidoglycan binding domain-containing protein [Nocardioides marmorisolisilvae]